MQFEDIFCFIPAKGASTRLPKKNILKLNGKEMLYYCLKAAQDSGLFDPQKIFVSTESPQVKEVAERYGANVPVLRDETLARDPYGICDVLLDFMETKPELKKHKYVAIVLPTSPLMIAEDVIACFQLMKNTADAKCVMAITQTEDTVFQSVTVNDGLIKPLFPDQMRKPSTLLPPTFRLNASVTMMNTEAFLKARTYHMDQVIPYVMPRERSVDVDTEFDFQMAKFFLEQRP